MKDSDYFPAGAYGDPNAPYNQSDVPEKEFEVTCSQSLSRTAIVTTNNYIPGASGCDYEPDGEGGYCACVWQDDDDTSNTNWGEEYKDSGYTTPIELIRLLRGYLSRDLDRVDILAKEENKNKQLLERRLKHLIEECDCWTEDDIEFCEG